jgi:hypothetical protein
MPTLKKGDILTKGLRRYRVERVTRSREYEGERLFYLRGQWATFGPFDVETIVGNGYELEQVKEGVTV